jgi:hydroxymethylglutaryl-CoA synthase
VDTSQAVGISGFSVYFPPHRVRLRDWCTWTGAAPEKIETVVGEAFRMCGERENVYTMAANAVLRLIHDHEIDPGRVGMLALGTESSTDNSAGAVIVRGMVDGALEAAGRPPLSRHCEVPEFKHACLGGVYALKAALRYLAVDGADRQAIVVSADIAEYARGSTGEPTQGAGAVAALVEARPQLLAVDLARAGSASSYRGPDFRKPFSRYRGQSPASRLRDFPVFNGKYSTTCYLDETLRAVQHALARQLRAEPEGGAGYLDRQRAVFLHRPYQKMPETGWAMIVLLVLASGGACEHAVLADWCRVAEVDPQALAAELTAHPRVFDLVAEGRIDTELYPLAQRVVKANRHGQRFRRWVEDKLALGRSAMRQVGNLYCGALPAWIAAGLEEGARRELALEGRDMLAIGYGSGDAAEVLPLRVMPGWRERALRTGFEAALTRAVDLTEQQYHLLHGGGALGDVSDGFVVERVGAREWGFDDVGVEYYRHPAPGPDS